MFSLTIALGSITWQLLYNKEEDAANARAVLVAGENSEIDLEDDFGQKLNARRMSIHGFMLEDMDKSALARIELALHATRTQVKGNQMAENDPALRQARSRQNMAVISPMGVGPGMPGFGNGRG